MGFLPENYEQAVKPASNYTKLAKGENTIRIMSEPLIGFVAWIDTAEGRRPQRSAERTGTPEEKPFFAVTVWNREEKAVQILELTQQTIIKPIIDFAKHPKLGDPRGYDIVITKSGEGKEGTKYVVMQLPKEEIDAEIVKAVDEAAIDLNQLMVGGEPFGAANGAASGASYKPSASSAAELAKPAAAKKKGPEDTIAETVEDAVPY